uniref:Flavonoid related MYB transcription factor 1 n=1 Tax=Carthamus tinctorius TaxID=4222 RepID=A0A2L1IUY5_CARTI|nr:flavonoid related MYB transcription factor 1 [Carthamus tinctorius]
MIQDQDHHVHTPPPPPPTAAAQPPLINPDKCFGIDSSPILPPLPPSFIVNPSSDFDHQFPTMEFLNSYEHHDILKPGVIGVQEFHPPETPFKLGDIELTPSINQPNIVDSNDLHTHASSQTEYLETFMMANFPSSSASPPSPILVLPQFVVSKVRSIYNVTN